MSAKPRFTTASFPGITRLAPLVGLGYALRNMDFFSPIATRLHFPAHMHTDRPWDALLTLFVSILAGCRSVSQINTTLRPDGTLATAWGLGDFAEQSTVARVLDSCQAEQVVQLREGIESLYHWIGQAPHHDWRNPLWVDIDLTNLLVSQRAEGSTQGYFVKRGPLADSYAGLAQRNMMRVSVRCCIPATPSVVRRSSLPSGN